MAHAPDRATELPTVLETFGTDVVAEEGAPGLGGVCVTTTGAVVVTEPGADRLRWAEPDGASISLGGMPGLADGSPATVRFRRPHGLAAAEDGSVVVADSENHAVRRIGTDREVTTLAGGLYGAVDGPTDQARFRQPQGVAVAADGRVYVADTGNDTVRCIDLNGDVTTLAGGSYGHGDIEAGAPLFRRPEAVAVGSDGTVYVADTGNDRVCGIAPSGRVWLVAGRRRPGLPPVPASTLRWPTSVAVAADGALFVTGAADNVVWRIGPDGATGVFPGDRAWRPVALALSPDGRLLVAEARWSPRQTIGRLRIVKVTEVRALGSSQPEVEDLSSRIYILE